MSRISVSTWLLVALTLGAAVAMRIESHHNNEVNPGQKEAHLQTHQESHNQIHARGETTLHHSAHKEGHMHRFKAAPNVSLLSSNELSLNLTNLRGEGNLLYDRLNWTDLTVARIRSQQQRVVERTVNAPVPPPPKQEVQKQLPEHPTNDSAYTSNLQANNWVSKEYFTQQWHFISTLNSSKHIRCSIQRPFYNGKECVACPNSYFSFDQMHCVNAPHGLTFDPNTHRFMKTAPHYITNLAAPRLDFAGLSKQEVREEYDNEIRRSGKQVCPKATPFYDSVACIQCFEPYAIFNLVSRRCTRCADTEEYSNKSLGCFESDHSGDLWTLPKALSNIFTGF